MQQNQNPNKVAATEAPRRVISLLVDNHNGVLARVSSLFCRRGFNIDSLTVSATNDPAVSRITVTITSDEKALSQLILQTERLEVTRQVFVLDGEKSLERELLLLKVASDVHNRSELREIASIYKAKIIDLSPDSMVFELIGNFAISNNSENELEVTVETGQGVYKKHLVYLNDWTIYVVEDVSGAYVDKFHYEVNFLPEMIIPVTVTSHD